MDYKIISHIACSRGISSLRPGLFKLTRAFYHDNGQELDDEMLPSEWYRAAYGKLIKLTHVLKNVEKIDGRLINTKDGSIVTDTSIITQMQSFSSLAKAFIRTFPGRFQKPGERNSQTLNSLTKVCNFLNISAQKRQSVRLSICPQVTQHHIWKGAIEQVLSDLKQEMESLNCHSSSSSMQMGEQILSSCIKFFSEATNLSSSESPSWMRPVPVKKVEKPVSSRTWEEVVEMFVDLTKCLEMEEKLASSFAKLEVMKEGLYQIRDIVVERDISYKEVRRQDCLVQRKLSKSLGHSSKCLFTLLLYYLYGTVRDVDIEICGGVQVQNGRCFVYIGKILTCYDEGMIRNGIKQLNKALGVFKFVWETAEMAGKLELEGHLWCVGAEERTITRRGSVFFVHEIRLP